MRQPSAADVVVVGGGVIGLSVAWGVSKRGADVVLVDRGALGAGASHVAAGMLAPVSEAELGEAGGRLLELGLQSARRWGDFAAELTEDSGLDPGLRRSGSLIVARDLDEAAALEREHRFRLRAGLEVSRLRGSEARRLEPGLAPGVRLALHAPEDHSVDNRALLAALEMAARRAGARLCPGEGVRRLLEDPAGTVTGVELEDGRRLPAERVVVAAGAWSASLGRAGGAGGAGQGAAVPVRPVKGQIVRLRDPAGPGLIERVLRFEGGYLVPRDDGGYVLGATVEERGFDTTVTAGAALELLREASELVPGITELEICELQAGLRPGTPDNVPLIGGDERAGLLWATGHHRNGILLAPITRELVCDELAGEPASPLAAACSPLRFRRASVEVAA